MINVIGQGYIGLPTALMLAVNGNQVVGTDKSVEVVEKLKNGTFEFAENGMSELYFDAKKTGNISYMCKYQETDFYIIAVPTPYNKRDKKVDAGFVTNAVSQVIQVCADNAVVVIESTISPGTIDRQIRPMIAGQKKRISLVHAPERIIPGRIIQELRENPRVIGADSVAVGEKVRSVYASFCRGEIVITDIKTAEMSKVVENTYRDINIAFANELAKICRLDHMDVHEIIRVANMHPRVNILKPGPGVGGHCISVDPWFLVGDYPGLANLILAARKINDSMPEFVLERISDIMEERGIDNLSRVGIYGLTYKEDVDDIRESPTLQLLDCLKRHCGNGIKIYDPNIHKAVVKNQILSFDDFLDSVDIIVIMVAHSHIKDHFGELSSKIVFDTRNVYYDADYYL